MRAIVSWTRISSARAGSDRRTASAYASRTSSSRGRATTSMARAASDITPLSIAARQRHRCPETAEDCLVLDDVQALFAQLRQAVQHGLDGLGVVALPVLQLADHPQRMAGPVGLGGV